MKKILQNSSNLEYDTAITLIALVITIVILIILAGIGISFVLGENGIVTRAQQAEKAQKIAQVKEKIGIELLDAEAESVIQGEKLEKEQINDIVSKYGELRRRWRYYKIKRPRK